MKKTLIVSALIITVNCMEQTNYKELISKFKPLTLPITEIEKFEGDSLNNSFVNNYLMFDSAGNFKAPMVKYEDGQLEKKEIYVGQYPVEKWELGMTVTQPDGTEVDKDTVYQPKIQSIGSLNLNPAFVCIIIRIESGEAIYYDLWSLNKEGKPLSQICLFYGLKKGVLNQEIEYVELESEITAEKQIKWHSNQRGLHTYCTWQLSEDGYFQTIAVRQEGKFEY